MNGFFDVVVGPQRSIGFPTQFVNGANRVRQASRGIGGGGKRNGGQHKVETKVA